jgi:hypothetical protein
VCLEWSIQNLTFLPRSVDDPVNSVRFSFETGIGGNSTGDKVTLKLYLEGERNREVKISYVSLEGSGLIDLVPEFRTIIVYIDLVHPVVISLPISLQSIGEVEKYLIKTNSMGHALIGVKLENTQNFQESVFLNSNQGPSQRVKDRFALAVKHDVLRSIIVDSFRRFDEDKIHLHGLNEDNVTFSSNSIDVRGGLTYSSPCGVFNVNLDLNYHVRATFSNPDGGLSILIHMGFSFADIGERIQATMCGIVEAIDDLRLPMLIVPAALAVVSPLAYLFAEDVANSTADDQLTLSSSFEGLTIKKINELTWRIDLEPVAALEKWGGLVYPLRFGEVNLSNDERVLLSGDQDIEPSTRNDDEAQFTGEIESVYDELSFEINERSIGLTSGTHTREVELYKTGDGLASVIDWEIEDDVNNCFSVKHEPLINLPDTYNTPLMRDLSRGSIILSPQNSFKLPVSFGPAFMRSDMLNDPGQRISYIPAAGEKFRAKLRVSYKTNDGDQSWHLKRIYLDLKGEITPGYHIEGPSIFTGPNIPHVFVPDEILHIANEIEAAEDWWEKAPGSVDYDLISVTALEPSIEELIVEEMDGTLLARALGSDDKVLSLSVYRDQGLRVKATSVNEGDDTHFYIQRHQLIPVKQISVPGQVMFFECRGDHLLAASGNNLYLYDVNDVTKPVLLGKSSFKNDVRILQIGEAPDTFLVSDGDQVQVIKSPVKPKRSIVAQRKKIPKKEGEVYALKQEKGNLSYVSEKQLNKRNTTDKNQSQRSSSLGSKIIMVRDEEKLNVYSSEFNPDKVLEGVPQLRPIEQENKKLYINRRDGGTAVVDITDPDRPVITAEYSAAQQRRYVQVRGNRAYRLVKDGKHIQTYKVLPCLISREKLNQITRTTLQS